MWAPGRKTQKKKRAWALWSWQLIWEHGLDTHTHTCACTHITPKWNSHTAQWMTMSVAKTDYTNEGWCQSCFWQNHLISRDLSLNRKLLKCLENCDKKIPGPMDNSWFFIARPTFDYILKLTSTKEKQKQLFENKFTL